MRAAKAGAQERLPGLKPTSGGLQSGTRPLPGQRQTVLSVFQRHPATQPQRLWAAPNLHLSAFLTSGLGARVAPRGLQRHPWGVLPALPEQLASHLQGWPSLRPSGLRRRGTGDA